MARPTLSADKISPAAAEKQSTFHRDIVDTVAAAVARLRGREHEAQRVRRA